MPNSRKSQKRKSHKRSNKKSNKIYLPKPTRGALGKYHVDLPSAERHRILNIKVRKLGYASVIRDLNLRATMLKNNSPRAHDIMRGDMDYLRREYR